MFGHFVINMLTGKATGNRLPGRHIRIIFKEMCVNTRNEIDTARARIIGEEPL